MLKLCKTPLERIGSSSTVLSIAVGSTLYFGCKENSALKNNEIGQHSHFSFDRLSSFSSPVVTLQFSGCGQYLATSYEDKTLRVWSLLDLNEIANCSLPKRATSLLFSKDSKYLLAADKTGDIKRYEVCQSMKLDESMLLGHSSFVLDTSLLQHTDSNVFIATCDRDEKIRISNYPNSYNIHTYCLGHKDFVSRLCTCPAYPHLLLSGSGDGTVCVWDWYNGSMECSLSLSSRGGAEEEDPPPVITELACSPGTPPIVAMTTDSKDSVTLAGLKETGQLGLTGRIECENVLASQFDLEGNLWLLRVNPAGKAEVLVYNISEKGKADLVSSDSFLDCINKVLESCDESPSSIVDWPSLRKRDFDNISAYYAKKEERIKNKKIKLDPSEDESVKT
ncbi:PREDICTED: tRNA (guanine-N(7)-)-methyltransferase non-catalytic subunit wdr4-like isoform X1 [Amphimedon queenslandica]|uniref:tRNA (guanine-N(7)-)-methyltransferase non-catalytic subunit n=1 Tax=Amphimedon queenslandica TaxID=400682 RepID=A0A1X7VHA1_AMPQE|nr:PREDICTED: tRNA (guanine-N(7)-)-methyltransferase non-catalytic subunit wdr4-like isoform X1 [Amphimedon queenslandica]|eukprot:XP_019848893.1 PREDICTED: tRNA (guanine-N(7)-)-methyltransferase non-catalytic subunit wdr4-like isoform X1 [Amphimedon queenslandica]